MTAAHCVNGIEAQEIRVYLGGHNITQDYTDVRRVRTIHAHENFDIITFDNDIALLQLDRPVRFGPTVQPGCLPDGSVTDYSMYYDLKDTLYFLQLGFYPFSPEKLAL